MPNKTSPVVIVAARRKDEELKLRISGMTYREIAQAMIARYGVDSLPHSYDERYAYADIKAEVIKLHASNLDTVNDLRMLEAQRLDQVQLAIMPKVLNGDLKAIDRFLKIVDTRAKLFGLYSPAQLKVHDWRSEILDLIKSGMITIDQAEKELGPELTQQLLVAGGSGAIEGRFTEVKDPEEPEDGS